MDQKTIDNAKIAGWNYSEKPHEKLGIHFATRKTKDGVEIMTEDRVRYSPDEVRQITKAGGITKNAHNIKKLFDGVIVDAEVEFCNFEIKDPRKYLC